MSAASRVGGLPEIAAVHWRPRMDEGRLRLKGFAWTASAVFQAVPMLATAGLMLFLDPVTVPVGIILLVHAWAIPELYANRGAKVVKPQGRAAGETAEATALGLLGDLVGHDARELHARTGLVLERGAFGVWLVGEAGALLVRGRRVHCWCVRATDPGAAVQRPDRAPAARAARRRGGLRDRRQPRLRGRALARAPAAAQAGAPALDAARRASRPTRPRG